MEGGDGGMPWLWDGGLSRFQRDGRKHSFKESKQLNQIIVYFCLFLK